MKTDYYQKHHVRVLKQETNDGYWNVQGKIRTKRFDAWSTDGGRSWECEMMHYGMRMPNVGADGESLESVVADCAMACRDYTPSEARAAVSAA